LTKPAHEILQLGAGDFDAELTLNPGEVFVVTGPNGVGKSAFLQAVPANGTAERFYGSRQIYFSSEDTFEIGQSLPQFFSAISGNVSRYRHFWGEQHLKSVVRRLIQRESQASVDIVKAQENGTKFAEARSQHLRPLDQLNTVFAAARLPVTIGMVDGTLKATRAGVEFTIDRMSDGERAALLLVGALVVQPANAFLLVDEPERHLNPSISGPLIAAAVRSRTDVGFLFATHDLGLIDWLKPDKTIHINDSTVVSQDTDTRLFSYALLEQADGIPENLRYALLGTRKALLLVEGTTSSEDRALYSHIYPGWNVVPREGWSSVVNGVAALIDNKEYHWLKVAGLIDGDGRSDNERAVLETKGVYTLPSPTIENIFLEKAVVVEMAAAARKLFGGDTVAQRLANLEIAVRRALSDNKSDIVARRVVWSANRALEASKISVDSVKNGQVSISAIDIQELRASVEAELATAMDKATVFEVLRSMPVKNTKIPGVVAHTIGFGNSKKYYSAVLNQIEEKTKPGVRIIAAMRRRLPNLPRPD
jgi:ABC-type multidrug transport system ATPase subunit